MHREKAILFLLRIGLAFAFLYPAISAYFNPLAWIGYFPLFILGLTGENDTLLLHAFGIAEAAIALWLLWGKYLFYPSVLAAAMLLGIVLFNFSQMDVLFRDISIATIALVLAIQNHPRHKNIHIL